MQTRNPEQPLRRKRKTLSRRELVKHVADHLLKVLRENEVRMTIKGNCANTDEEIEAVLRTPSLGKILRQPVEAFIVERTTQLIKRLFESAVTGEAWAWRVILEVSGLADHFREAVAKMGTLDEAVFVSAGFEQRLIQDLRELATPEAVALNRNSCSGQQSA